MQCTTLIRLTKGWFLHVREETMAPARMMQFIDQHIKDCATCREDPDLHQEIEKIREFILPESKIPKAYRSHAEAPTPEISPPAPPTEVKPEPAPEDPPAADKPAS
jgi:hypothetical protein